MFEENTLIGQMAKGKYPTIKVETKYGFFVLKYPSGKDEMIMDRKKALYFGGLPIDSYDLEARDLAHINATLSVAISEYPTDFPGEYKKDDFVDFPDKEVKNALYKAFLEFLKGIREKMSN